MLGFLIYEDSSAKYNKFFVDELIKNAKNEGIDLILKCDIDSLFKLKKNELPDFAIIRVINPKLNAFFETQNIPCFNNYKTSLIANDKYKTYQLAKKLNIKVMDTLLFDNKCLNNDYPFILKSVDGHGGKEVFFINNQENLKNALLKLNHKKCIKQKIASSLGLDMRIYVLNQKILAAILRESKTDFRSNFSLGGEVKLVTINKEQEEVVKKICQNLDPAFIGIDFIRHHGKWILNEIEDVVGSRMLYKCTKIDVALLYIKYIKNKLQSLNIEKKGK